MYTHTHTHTHAHAHTHTHKHTHTLIVCTNPMKIPSLPPIAWFAYLMVGLFISSLGLFFYYGFKDFPKLAVHIWAWFM